MIKKLYLNILILVNINKYKINHNLYMITENKYVVATLVLYTPEEDEIILRFIIFEDGTIFEFYGNYGSLRSHTIIDDKIAKSIINNCSDSNTYNYQANIKDVALFNILQNGIITKYLDMYNNIDEVYNNLYKCFILTKEVSNAFIVRMIDSDMLYATDTSLELFNQYKNRLD